MFIFGLNVVTFDQLKLAINKRFSACRGAAELNKFGRVLYSVQLNYQEAMPRILQQIFRSVVVVPQ